MRSAAISSQEKFWWCWIVKEYTNDEITVFWDPKKCIHSAECLKSQPGVFDVHKSPWINMDGATTEEIMAAIDRCPSG
ncbi:MAG: (4Fe-4S)-binding protein, partial [Methanothrix sp.]